MRLVSVGGFNQPTYVHGPKGAGDVVFVVEKAGRVRVVKGGRVRSGAFLDITRKVSSDGERGLLSIAFRNYKRSRLFYVYYTDRDGDLRIVEYKRKRGKLKARPRSGRLILEIRHREFSNHNGGQLQWGPDRNLWIGTGDGGGAGDPHENAQSKRSLLGKMLRIKPRKKGKKGRRAYRIPKGNPYRKKPGRNEIFSIGLRNPWRFSFDRKRIAIGDVGQSSREEVDFETLRGARGANFGWDRLEGTLRHEGSPPRNHERPIFEYPTGPGGTCAITGGYVVRDRDLPSLEGRYVYGDFCAGQIRSFRPSTSGASGDAQVAGLPNVPALSSFGVDARKRVYVASLSGGVWRIAPG